MQAQDDKPHPDLVIAWLADRRHGVVTFRQLRERSVTKMAIETRLRTGHLHRGFSPSGRRVWVTAGRVQRLAIYAARGREPIRLLPADTAPQHVSFGPSAAYVASGEGPSLRVHSLASGRVLREARTPYGSYNVQRRAGRVLTPSLSTGVVTALDASGRVQWRTRIAPAAHDACVVL